MKIARSGIAWFISKVGSLGITFLATLYFTRALADPTRTLGTFQLFETVLSFLLLVSNVGVAPALNKRLSEDEERPAYAGAGLLLLLSFSSIGLMGILLFRDQIQETFQLGGLAPILLAGLLLISVVDTYLGNVLTGTYLVGRRGFVQFARSASKVAVQVTLIAVGFGVVGLIYGVFAGILVAIAIALYFLWPIDVELPEQRHVRSLLSYGKYSFLVNIETKFYDNIDTIAIAYFLNNAAVGLYNIPFRLSLVLFMASGAIGTASFPQISRSSAQEDIERIREIFADALVFTTLLPIPATVGIYLLAEPVVVTFFTPEFAAGATVAFLGVAIQIPGSVRSILKDVTNGMDRPDLTLRGSVIVIATNGLLDVLLIPIIGIEGAAIASLAAITLATAYLGLKVGQLLDLGWRAIPFRTLGAELFAAGVMGIVVYWLRELPAPYPILRLVGIIGAGVVVYFAVLLAVSPGVRSRIGGIVDDLIPEFD